jgi:hypothetical protein
MTCPICGNLVTFPAIPPKSAAKGLRLDRPTVPVARKWAWKPRGMFLFLRDFPHWKIIGGILLPFLIIGGLLEGAGYVKRTFTDQPTVVAPIVASAPVAPGAWQQSVDLSLAEQAVRDKLKIAQLSRAAMRQAEQIRNNTRRQYDASNPYVAKAEEAFQRAQNNDAIARSQFNEKNSAYLKLGGKFDYSSQLPN